MMVSAALADGPGAADIALVPADNVRLANLNGPLDENLRHIERRLGVEISSRGEGLRVIGAPRSLRQARQVLLALYEAAAHGPVEASQVHLALHEAGHDDATGGGAPSVSEPEAERLSLRTRRGEISPRGRNQQHYIRSVQTHDINFGVGPAGTGKTYLAVSCAVDALEREKVRRIVLVRPAVEAGERLGFLPGDLAQKVDPYLRPLYDALYEMLGFERAARLVERNVIEIAPLAFMRGRTLNESFIILDEAQNTTIEQMKMFLTRIGFGATAVITGDVTQVDLPRGKGSGLRHAIEVLRGVSGVSFTFFDARDVVRHPIVQRIVTAYEDYEKSQAGPED
jgi:phosphate starvation-inducible PhoH-like protein